MRPSWRVAASLCLSIGGPYRERDEGGRTMERIVVGVDGSPGARRAVAWAAREAEHWGATLIAIHAWSVPVMAAPTGLAPMPIVPDVEDLAGPARAVLDDALAEVRTTHPGVTIEPRVVEGAAADVLLHAAEGADLLVVGSQGHGAVIGMLLGSVSQHLSHHATCPLVLVPAPK